MATRRQSGCDNFRPFAHCGWTRRLGEGPRQRATIAYAPASKTQVAPCCNQHLRRRRRRGTVLLDRSHAPKNAAALSVGKSSAWRETTSYFSRLQPRGMNGGQRLPLCPCRQPSHEKKKKLRDCQRQQWAISFVRSRYSPESL